MVNENIYKLDVYKQGQWLLHKGIRQVKRIVVLKAMLYGIINVVNNFFVYRNAKIYQLTITDQVCYLKRMLNDAYDLSLRRIIISDAVWHLPWFLYQEDELKPEGLYKENENEPVYLYRDGEAGEALNDFVVLVPVDINFSEAEMRAKIDSYKLFGTSYTIQRI